MRSAASELGTLSSSVSPSYPSGRTPGNQAAQVAGASCSRSVAEPWSQISSAVSAHRSFVATARGHRECRRLSTGESTGVEISPDVLPPVRPGRAVPPGGAPTAGQWPSEARNVAPVSLAQQGADGFSPTRCSGLLRVARALIGPLHFVVSASRAVPHFGPRATASRGLFVEAHVPTQQPQARQDARFSDPHEDCRWAGGAFPPPGRRPKEADRQLREVAGSRRFQDPAFPRVSGSFDPANSERSTITGRGTRVPFLLPSVLRKRERADRGLVSRRPGVWGKRLCATVSADGCGKQRGLSWRN